MRLREGSRQTDLADLLDREAARFERLQNCLRRNRLIEPGGPVRAPKNRNLPIMVRLDVGPGRDGQHSEAFADNCVRPPDSRDAEPRLAGLGE